MARLQAVQTGIEESGIPVQALEPERAERAWLHRVHSPAYVDAIERFCRSGGGHLDHDTVAGPDSWEAALRAAGAGPQAVEVLRDNQAVRFAFLALRPPGHHATMDRAMGFCLFNNVAVTAAGLRADGDRVAIVDWDVHHGNGTQAAFWSDPGVLYMSVHQYPFYPYEGWLEEVGGEAAAGTTINLPVPAGTAGDVYREAWERVMEPVLTQFNPDWLLISAGYDAHCDDPLAELRLEANDYGWMAARLSAALPNVPAVALLEGGYNLRALTTSVTATLLGWVSGEPELSDTFHSPAAAFRSVEELAVVASRYWSL
jgi:acetoin utilization deacetylase AcuC-like enzyme